MILPKLRMDLDIMLSPVADRPGLLIRDRLRYSATTLIIPPSPINLDSITAVGLLGSINVAFAGFDNTYTASQIAFTFYDITGKALPQGAIDVNATTAFQQYFSTTQAGGSFQVLAMFPVTGNGAEIGFVTVQIVNSLGTTTAAQISIGN